MYTPIAGVLTQNRYTYVNGGPINMVDPTRHRSQAVIDEEYLQCVYILQFQLN